MILLSRYRHRIALTTVPFVPATKSGAFGQHGFIADCWAQTRKGRNVTFSRVISKTGMPIRAPRKFLAAGGKGRIPREIWTWPASRPSAARPNPRGRGSDFASLFRTYICIVIVCSLTIRSSAMRKPTHHTFKLPSTGPLNLWAARGNLRTLGAKNGMVQIASR